MTEASDPVLAKRSAHRLAPPSVIKQKSELQPQQVANVDLVDVIDLAFNHKIQHSTSEYSAHGQNVTHYVL
eukprot:SAG11_NODE_18567_length_487_cov_0.930412_1_plen_70_part_10